jgi:hypothetical protein
MATPDPSPTAPPAQTSPPKPASPRSWTSTGWRSASTVPGLGPATARAAVAQATRFDVATFRQRRPQLLARRDAELATAYQLLGRLPVSELLPNTDKEAKLIREDIVTAFAALPEHPYHSARELVQRNRDPQDPLKLRDFAFVHVPGGHAQMIDFVDNPYLGELLNTLHEDGVLISLICHAPVAMVCAKYRVAADGEISTTSDHHFKGARLAYYVDEAFKEAGYQVEAATNRMAA